MSPVTEGTAGAQADRTLEALQQVTDVALAYLPLEELLGALLERIARILTSDTAAFLLLDESRQELVARAAKGIEEEVERGVRIPVGKGFAGRIAAARSSIAIEDVDHAEILNPILRIKGIRSLLGVPLLVEGQVIGVLHVGTLTPRIFTDDDHSLLQLAADRAALAIERARFYEQRRGVEALQRALLPDHLPAIPGIELAARYRPSAVGHSIGGDWYDVFRLGGGRIGLVIGDVMGHGVAAAALMAELRTALRAYALDGHPPAEVAERMNRLLAPRRPDDDDHARLPRPRPRDRVGERGQRRARAPAGDRPRRFDALPRARRRPAGRRVQRHDLPRAPFRDADRHLGRARHRRRRRGPRGAARPRAGAPRGARPPGAGRGTTRHGDRARRGDVGPLQRRSRGAGRAPRGAPRPPADELARGAEALGAMRHMLRRWLGRRDADADEVYDITLAVQEACANAIEHAYAPGPAAFDVDASHEDGLVTVAIRDRGRWRAARGRHRGRGLPLMEALMESVDVHRTDEGTTIVLRRTIGRPLAP